MSTKVYHSPLLTHSLRLLRSLSLFLKKKSHRTRTNGRTEQGKCNDTVTLTTIKEEKQQITSIVVCHVLKRTSSNVSMSKQMIEVEEEEKNSSKEEID